MNESQCLDHFGETLGVLQEADDQVLGLADMDGGDDVDRSGGGITSWERCADCCGPSGPFLRKETAMQPELGVDLVAIGARSVEQVGWVEGTRTPEPVFW